MHQVETKNNRSPPPLRLAICIMPIALTLVLLTGCGSQGPIKVSDLVERGEYEAAMQDVKNNYSCEGKDRLLCEMMLAMIEHRFGHYQASGYHLQIAEQKAEELYTISLLEWLIQTITNPGVASYRGTEYEWVYLSYLSAINYLNLARTARNDRKRREQLAEARVEIRRVDIKLHDIETRKGTYDEAGDEKREFLHQVLQTFKALQGNLTDSKDLQFREDGYLRYLTGIVYEMLGEWDDACIAYQKAAKLYEQGYIKQYGLSEGMDEQAWFDTIRMMQKGGYSRSKRNSLARQKLDAKQRALLKNYSNDVAQLIVIEHFDRVPQTGVLNMVLRVNRPMKAFVLSPVPLRGTENNQAPMSWFRMVYADRGILPLIYKYNHNGLIRVAVSPFEKTIVLGPLWDVFERNKMISAIEKFPLRITVPYMRPLPENIGYSSLTVNGHPMSSLQSAESVAQLAIQAQLRNAGLEIMAAVARSLIQLKTVMDRLEKLGLGDNLSRLSSFVPNIMTAAETRSWMLLPYIIRMTRVALKPGRHEAELVIRGLSGHELDRQRRTLDLKAGQIAVWTTFTSGKEIRGTTPVQVRAPMTQQIPSRASDKQSQSVPFGAFFEELKKILEEVEKERKR
jgi:hypothetical protein